MKILVIDDSSEYRNRWRNLLEILNHEVVEAEDGFQGIDQIKSNDDLNLIISDLHMPELNGIEMCRKIKEENIQTPKILMVTTEANPELKKQGIEVGVFKWILKRHLSDDVFKMIINEMFK
jgi:two-component system chemotaxis response regulator CheY